MNYMMRSYCCDQIALKYFVQEGGISAAVNELVVYFMYTDEGGRNPILRWQRSPWDAQPLQKIIL